MFASDPQAVKEDVPLTPPTVLIYGEMSNKPTKEKYFHFAAGGSALYLVSKTNRVFEDWQYSLPKMTEIATAVK